MATSLPLTTSSTSTSAGRKRASKPKARTGCLTCKTRRVKCDETHPFCLRCLRYSGTCDGYSAHRARPRAKSALVLPAREKPPPLLLPRILPERRFRNDLEQFYFDSFREEVAPGLTGVYASSIWDRIMLQASHHEQFIHDAVIALSALSMSLRVGPASTPKHHLVAMKYYDSAVRSMQRNLSCPRRDLRKALLSCLLVYSFESLEGDQVLAVSHAKGGLSLIRSLFPDFKDGSLCSEMSIEADVISAFHRIDLQVFLMGSPEQISMYRGERLERDQELLDIPYQFESMIEADTYWQIVLRQTGHFIYKVMAANVPPPSRENILMDGSASDLDTCSSLLNTSLSISSILRRNQRFAAAQLLRWEDAFEPLRLSLDPTQRSMAVYRRIAFLSVQVLVGSILFTDECSCDEFLPQHREIVSQSWKFIRQDSNRKFPITYDLGIIPSLYVLTKTCRNPTVRRGAIAVLRDSPRREGIWDSLLVAEVSEWLMQAEEKGLEGDFIPEHARIKITNSYADSRAKVVRLTWTRWTSKEDRTPLTQKSTLPWNGGIHANFSVAK